MSRPKLCPACGQTGGSAMFARRWKGGPFRSKCRSCEAAAQRRCYRQSSLGERDHAFRLWRAGMSAAEVGRLFGRGERTVRGWISRRRALDLPWGSLPGEMAA